MDPNIGSSAQHSRMVLRSHAQRNPLPSQETPAPASISSSSESQNSSARTSGNVIITVDDVEDIIEARVEEILRRERQQAHATGGVSTSTTAPPDQHPILPISAYTTRSHTRVPPKKRKREEKKAFNKIEAKRDSRAKIAQLLEQLLLDILTTINRQRLRRSRRLPRNLRLKDSLRIFLIYLIDYQSTQLLERKYAIPHSSFDGMILPVLLDRLGTWAKVFISKCWSTATQRAQIARDHNPEEFSRVTTILDGTDCPIIKPHGTRIGKGNPYYSFKLEQCALRTQVLILSNSIVGWASESKPAATHDLTVLRNSNFFDMLDQGDVVMMDKGYTGVLEDFQRHRLSSANIVIQKKKPANGQLSDMDRERNERISQVRTRVEQLFGQLKQRFSILSKPFRHDPQRFNTVFVICCALNNLIMQLSAHQQAAREAAATASQLLFGDEEDTSSDEEEDDDASDDE